MNRGHNYAGKDGRTSFVRMEERMGSYINREDYAQAGDECKASQTCQLQDGHGGNCDSRTEQQRWQARALEERARKLEHLSTTADQLDPGPGMKDHAMLGAVSRCLAQLAEYVSRGARTQPALPSLLREAADLITNERPIP